MQGHLLVLPDVAGMSQEWRLRSPVVLKACIVSTARYRIGKEMLIQIRGSHHDTASGTVSANLTILAEVIIFDCI